MMHASNHSGLAALLTAIEMLFVQSCNLHDGHNVLPIRSQRLGCRKFYLGNSKLQRDGAGMLQKGAAVFDCYQHARVSPVTASVPDLRGVGRQVV